MSDTPRAELTGAAKAVSETLDEVNFRMHGLLSSGSYHQQFIDWLAEHGYTVTPTSAPVDVPARFRAAAEVVAPGGSLCRTFRQLADVWPYVSESKREAIWQALIQETTRP